MRSFRQIRKVKSVDFANWLENETKTLSWKEFHTESGRYALEKARRRVNPMNPPQVVIEGMYVTLVSEQGKPEIEHAVPVGECIRFDLVPLDSERTEITTTCIESEPVLAYCHKLLVDIEKRWHTDTNKVESKNDQSARMISSEFVPKRKLELKKWKDSWSIIRRTRIRFDKQYREGNTDNPNPKLDDLREALATSKIKWKPSAKTVSRIIEAGDKGLLK